MASLHCYRIRDGIGDHTLHDLSRLVDATDRQVTYFGPVEGDGFVAALAVAEVVTQPPEWVGFVRQGFTDVQATQQRSISSVLFVAVTVGRHRPLFAFTFGQGGRFLLPDDIYDRGFGLRCALNIVYPRIAGPDDPGRLKGVASKWREEATLRSERQSSRGSTFDAFDVDRVREIIGSAFGVPHDEATWGHRVGGSDPLHLSPPNPTFDGLGRLCIRIEDVWRLDDYRERFGWIDNVRPITDPTLISTLENEVVSALRAEQFDPFDLAPPEVLDWTEVAGFRYHFDPRAKKGTTPHVRDDLRLVTYVRGLAIYRPAASADLDADYLRRAKVRAVDGDGRTKREWSVWRCLTGEVRIGDDIYVLDEGDFFAVASDFNAGLNAFLDGLSESHLALPTSTTGEKEGDYNRRAASSLSLVLLDDNPVYLKGERGIEVCDLLSPDRQLVHVKKGLQAPELSHLFAQGRVSADLLQRQPDFRAKTGELVASADRGATCAFFGSADISTKDFEIVYAIVANWKHRSLAAALPFFSKINLQHAVEYLSTRGYRVAYRRVETA
jgi:uncharacterized protein (TIGR04141 family)